MFSLLAWRIYQCSRVQKATGYLYATPMLRDKGNDTYITKVSDRFLSWLRMCDDDRGALM